MHPLWNILDRVNGRDFEVALVVWLGFWMDHVARVDGYGSG
jgi:hypothetical protein